MKKFFLFLNLLFLFGCTAVSKDGRPCFDVQTFKVLQGLEDGALAFECPWYEDWCSLRPLVYLESPMDVDYYDQQEVSSESETCWVQDRVYRYSTKNDIIKTVPKLILVDK